MRRLYQTIKRRHTGASPETFQFRLNLLTVTAFFLFTQTLFSYVNKQSQFRIYGGGAKKTTNHLPFQKLCSSL